MLLTYAYGALGYFQYIFFAQGVILFVKQRRNREFGYIFCDLNNTFIR